MSPCGHRPHRRFTNVELRGSVPCVWIGPSAEPSSVRVVRTDVSGVPVRIEAAGCTAGVAPCRTQVRLASSRRADGPPAEFINQLTCASSTILSRCHGCHGSWQAMMPPLPPPIPNPTDNNDNRRLSPAHGLPGSDVSPRIVPGQSDGTSSNTSCIRHSLRESRNALKRYSIFMRPLTNRMSTRFESVAGAFCASGSKWISPRILVVAASILVPSILQKTVPACCA